MLCLQHFSPWPRLSKIRLAGHMTHLSSQSECRAQISVKEEALIHIEVFTEGGWIAGLPFCLWLNPDFVGLPHWTTNGRWIDWTHGSWLWAFFWNVFRARVIWETHPFFFKDPTLEKWENGGRSTHHLCKYEKKRNSRPWLLLRRKDRLLTTEKEF